MRFDLSRFARLGGGRSDAPPPSGVTIGAEPNGAPVVLPEATRERAGHLLLGGSSGCGKSVMLSVAIARQIAAEAALPQDGRATRVLIDPKGDCASMLVSALAHMAPERLDDVVWLDPFDRGFPGNVAHLAIPSAPPDVLGQILAQVVSDVSTGTGSSPGAGGAGARQVELLSALLSATLDATAFEARSPLWALDALRDEEHGLEILARVVKSRRIQEALLGRRIAPELRASTSARLRSAFAYTERLEAMSGAPSCVQPTEITTAPGRLTILYLAQPPAGETALTAFQARLWARLILTAALERPSNVEQPQLYFYFEELPVYADTITELLILLLQTGRSRRITVGAAVLQVVQLLQKYSPELLPVMLGNAELICGTLAAKDAELITRQLAPPKGVEEPVAAYRARTTAEVVNLRQREFVWIGQPTRRFRSRDEDLGAIERAADSRADELEALRTRFGDRVPSGERVRLAEAARGSTASATSAGPRTAGGSRSPEEPPPPRTPWD